MRVGLNLEQLLYRTPGGIGSYTAELARLLPEQVHAGEPTEVVGFVARHSKAQIDAALQAFALTRYQQVGWRPIRLPLPRPLLYDAWNVLGQPSLAAMSNVLRGLDVVHAPSLAVPPRSGGALVVTVHDAASVLYPESYPRHGRWFHSRGLAAAARRADLVVAPSEAAAQEIAEHTAITRDRIRVVAQGVTLRSVTDDVVAATSTRLGLGVEPYVLWVGTLEPRKNLTVLVEAFRRFVAETDLPHRLVLVGPAGWLGTADAIREPASALGDRVRLTGAVSHDDVVALYRGAELFAFPSIHEGFGIPVIEAMAQSTPVLCSDIPVFHEVADGAAAFASPHDPDVWADQLARLLGDPAARDALTAKGLDRVLAFSWEKCAAQTFNVYREALSH